MNPGRELDALIAEKVMGWKLKYNDYGKNPHWVNSESKAVHYDDHFNTCPADEFSPSTDIKDAWEVVEHFTKKGQDLRIQSEKDGTFWRCYITDEKDVFKEHWNVENVWDAPYAICLAALKTISEQK